MFKSFGRYVGKAAPTAIALVLVAGFAHATVPDSSGMIHACYANKGGALRVINTDSGQHCTTKQTALNWSGSNIVARERWTGPLLISVGGGSGIGGLQTLPSWTQGAGEVDQILPGSVTLTLGKHCTGSVALTVQVPGYVDLSTGLPFTATLTTPGVGNDSEVPETLTLPLGPGNSNRLDLLTLFEPGAPTARSLAVSIGAGGGCNGPDDQVTLDSFSFDVEGLR